MDVTALLRQSGHTGQSNRWEDAVKTIDRYVSIIATTLMGGSLAALLGNVVPHAPSAAGATVCGVVLGFGTGLLINALR